MRLDLHLGFNRVITAVDLKSIGRLLRLNDWILDDHWWLTWLNLLNDWWSIWWQYGIDTNMLKITNHGDLGNDSGRRWWPIDTNNGLSSLYENTWCFCRCSYIGVEVRIGFGIEMKNFRMLH